MTRNVVTMNSNETVSETIDKYRDYKVGSLIIRDNDRCVGIVTERDIIERAMYIDPETKIEEIMSSDIKSIRPLEKIETAVDMMERYKIKKLPVISDSGKLVGIITITDIAYKVPELTERVDQFFLSWLAPSWKE
ncbi:MAG: CBS domain-containing protein [Candidatus Thermoplasmatota archaeon]|nr:CBS domain-containing protein [Candidatus Thermoplasmatota archaeon]